MEAPASEPKRTHQLAVVLATASVTLALGATAAALGGYLHRPGEARAEPAPPATAPTEAPNVVLVPVTREPPAEPAPIPASPQPERTILAYQLEHEEQGWRWYAEHGREDGEGEDDDD